MERVFNLKVFALLRRSLPWLLGATCMLEVFLTSEMLHILLLANLLSGIKLVLFALIGLSLFVDIACGKLAPSFGVLLLLVCFLLGVGIYIATGGGGWRTLFILLPLLLMALRRSDFKRVAFAAGALLGVGLVLVIFLALIGALPNEVFSYRGETERYTLGFTYATMSQSLMLFSALSLNYALQKRTPSWLLVAEAALSVFIYTQTDTRTGLGLTLAVVTATLAHKLLAKKEEKISRFFAFTEKRWVYNTLCFLPLLLFFGFGLLVLLYARGNPLAVELNGFFSNRLALTANAFSSPGLTLFGQAVDWMDGDIYIGVDSSWYFYLFNMGVFGFLMVMAADIFALRHALKTRNLWLVFALLICFADGIFEAYLCDVRYNIFVLSLAFIADGKPLFPLPKRKKENEESTL